MRRTVYAVIAVLSLALAGVCQAGDWNLVKNVKRLERVSPDYQDDKAIDKKFLDVLDLTEKTRKEGEVYDEAKRIAAMPALAPSKYMDSFLYYMLVRSAAGAKNSTVEPDFWFSRLKAYDKSAHVLAAYLVRMKLLPRHSPELRMDAQTAVQWVKAQKPTMKVRAPEYSGNMLLGYRPRTDFAEGDPLKLYSLSYYKDTVTPAPGFLEDDTYVNLLSRIKDGREDVLAEMTSIYKKMGKRLESSALLYQQAMLKAGAKDFQQAKVLLDEAVKYNPGNTEAKKERDRIKLELTYLSLAPAAAPAEAAPAAAVQAVREITIPEHLQTIDTYLVPVDRVIAEAELGNRSLGELRVMRNEVFARHGRIFEAADLRDYFLKKTWYRQNQNYADSLLTEVDKENVRILQNAEARVQ